MGRFLRLHKINKISFKLFGGGDERPHIGCIDESGKTMAQHVTHSNIKLMLTC
jgi:hypothetical protein